MKFVSIVLLSLLVSFSAFPQKDKVKFHSINSIGLSEGESGAHLLLQTINGVAFDKWFSGIGFGADYYQYKSYPLFLDLRRYFGKRDKGFAYANLGYNLDAKNKPGKETYYTTYHFSSGIYSDFGLGIKMKFISRSSLLLSAGFSYKDLNNKVSVTEECFVAPCAVDYSKYKYGNGRVVLKAGVDF